jgi:hypothetical protein
MRIDQRLAKAEQTIRDRPPPGQFDVIQAVPIERAGGREPGLYKDGPSGSTAGLLVFDPAQGEPVVPEGRLAPWGLLIVCGPETVGEPL